MSLADLLLGVTSKRYKEPHDEEIPAQVRRSECRKISFLVLTTNEHVLLTQRKQTGHLDGQYSFPSSHVRFGEMPSGAAARVAQHSLGVTLRADELVLMHVLFNKVDAPYLYLFFRADKFLGAPKNAKPQKIADIGWYHPRTIPGNTAPYVRWCLDAEKEGVPYSELGSELRFF